MSGHRWPTEQTEATCTEGKEQQAGLLPVLLAVLTLLLIRDAQKHGASVGCSEGHAFMNRSFNFRGWGGGWGPRGEHVADMCGVNHIDSRSVSLALSLSKSSPSVTASDTHGFSCLGRLMASLVCVSFGRWGELVLSLATARLC